LKLKKIAIRAIYLVTTEDPLITKIRRTPQNKEATRILKINNAKESNRLILWKRIVYMLKILQKKVLAESHNRTTARHFRNNKTIKQLTRIY
jgi:hypothetical protein